MPPMRHVAIGRLRPLQRDRVRGSSCAARRLPSEETILPTQPERAQLPTLCVLTTSAVFHEGDPFITPSSYRLAVAAMWLNFRCWPVCEISRTCQKASGHWAKSNAPTFGVAKPS